jgi:thioredoxin-dependent peroxiredoxin
MDSGRLVSMLPEPVKEAVKARIWPKLLAESETVPEWQLEDQHGAWHRQGIHWTVMAFLPPIARRPEVKTLLADLEAHHERLAALGASVFAIMAAEKPELSKIAKEHGLSFPLLSDPDSSVARMFRAVLRIPLGRLTIPTLYLVNPDRKIRLANRGTPAVEAVVRSIEALQQTTRRGM